MSIQRSITDHFILRILCHRLGSTSEELYNKVFNLLTKTCQKILLPSSLPKEFKVQAKQKVPEKDWFMGWIKCQYYNDIPPVEWPECQMAYKCNAAFIILDIANYDPQKCSHELKNIKRTLYNEQIFCYYLLVWNSDKGSASCYEEEKEFIIVPDMKTDESLSDFLYKQTQLLVVKTGMHFFQVIEKLSSDVYVIALFNAKEEIPKDQIKVKKRKQGRALKLCGDLAIILGCWSDANGFYTRAHKQLEINDDYVWLGKVKEGQMACLYMQFLFGEAEQGTADQVMKRLARDSKEKLEAASACYKKAKTLQAVDFDVELYFKRLRIFKDLKSLQDFQELFKQYSEVVKSSLKGEETYKAMLLIASFFYDMKMYKKAGLYLKLLGDTIVADNYDLVLARDIYLACFPLYSMCLPESTLPESFPKREFLKTIIENEDLKSGIMRVAPALQMQLIIDVVRLSNNEKPLQAKMLSIILRYFMEDLDVRTQKQVFAQFMMLGQSLHTNLTLDLSLVPKLLKVIPLAETSKANIKFNDTELSKSNIFIYNPWKGDNDEKNRNYNWMEGSFCCVKVQLSNIFPFEIFVEMIMLVTEGIQAINYPVSMNLHSRQPLQEIVLKFKPLEAGKLHILGVMIKVSNFMHFHPINSKGICIEPVALDKKGAEANGNHHQNNDTNKLGIREIPIQESISTLSLSFEDKEETLQLCKKSPFHARVIVKNKNDCFMRVHKITIVLVFSDSSIFEQEYDPQESKLKEYDVSSIVIYRSILKEEGNVLELFKNEIRVMFKLNLNDIPNIDMLSKISIKLTYFQQHRPTLYIEEYIAKSINMKQGLSVTRLGVYGSFINNMVSFEGKEYKHINVDNSFYLSLEVVRADPINDENEYVITFQREDTKEIIGKESLSSHQTSIKVVIKLELSSLVGLGTELDDLRKLIIGKWTEKNLIGSGYLFLEDIDMSPLTSKLRDRQLEVSLDVDMTTKDDMMEAVQGQFYTIQARVKWLGNEAKSLYCFTVICRDRELDSGKVMKKEKNVVYKGRKYSVMEFGRGKVEECMSVDVMLVKRECYKVFFFAVDSKDSTIYSLKHPSYISVT